MFRRALDPGGGTQQREAKGHDLVSGQDLDGTSMYCLFLTRE